MKRFTPFLIYFSSIFFLANWSSQETSVDGGNKPAVNFYGTIVTRKNESYEVENIMIGGIFKEIPVFESPALNNQATTRHLKPSMTAQQEDAESTEQPSFNGTALANDPKDGIISNIDLAEIAEIQIPEPEKIWTFTKRKGSRKVDYIEVIIESNDQRKTKNHFLIDTHRKITLDKVNPAGPIEQVVPFTALKKLIIKGYRYRDEKKEKNQTKKSREEKQESQEENRTENE